MKPYDRAAALRYAEQWAMRRNPDFFDFEELGGDCTNFASQCLYAGSRVMNFAPPVRLVLPLGSKPDALLDGRDLSL